MNPRLARSVWLVGAVFGGCCYAQVVSIPVFLTAEQFGPPVTQNVSVPVSCDFGGLLPIDGQCYYSVLKAPAAWLSVSPNSGGGFAGSITGPGPCLGSVAPGTLCIGGNILVQVTGNPAGLSAGSQQSMIAVTSSTGPAVAIAVTMSVVQPALQQPNALSFTHYTPGLSVQANIPVVSSNGNLNFSASPNATFGGHWLDVNPRGGTTNETIQALIDSRGLSPGNYYGSIQVTSAQARNQISVPVTLNVLETDIVPRPSSASFQFYQDMHGITPVTSSASIALTANHGTLNPTITSAPPWLSASLNSSTTPATLTISVAGSSVPVGTLSGNITISAPGAFNSPLNIPVSATTTLCSYTLGQLSGTFSTGPNVPDLFSVPVTANADQCLWFDTDSSTDVGWISLFPGSFPHYGSGLFQFTVFSNNTLAPRTGHLTVVGQTIPITEPAAVPSLSILPGNLANFVTTPTGIVTAPDVEQVVTNIAGSTLNYTASASSSNTVYPTLLAASQTSPPYSGGSWLTVTPSGAGTTPGTITISANPAGLAPGYYVGAYSLTATGQSPLVIPVMLHVPYFLYTDRDSIYVQSANPAMATFALSDTNGPLSFTTFVSRSSSSVSAVSATPSGTTPATITLDLQPAQGEPDLTRATILVSGNVNGNVIDARTSVSLTYDSLPSRPVFSPSLDPPCCTTAYLQGGGTPPAQSFSVTSTGKALTCHYAGATSGGITADDQWITLTPKQFTTPAVLSLVPNDPSTLNDNSASFVFYYSCGTDGNPADDFTTFQIDANLSILPNSNSGTATPSQLTFWAETSGANPASQTVQLTTANGPLPYNITFNQGGFNYSWLSASSSGNAPETLTVSVDKTGLVPGIYSGFVGLGREIPGVNVKLYVTSKHFLMPGSTSASFTATAGGSAPAPLVIPLGASTNLAFTAAAGSDAGWLGVMPASGSAPGSISLTADPTGLPPGNYKGKVTLTSAAADNSPLIIPVTLSVGACAYSLNSVPVSLPGGSLTGTVSVTTSPGCSWTAASSDTTWLTIASPTGSVTGSGVVAYAATENTTGAVRTATLTIAGQTVTTNQPPPCSFSLNGTALEVPASGMTTSITVTSPVACPWIVSASDTSVVSLSGTNPTQGSGSLSFTIPPNTGPARTTVITIGNQSFTIMQDSGVPNCGTTLDGTMANFSPAAGTGSVTVTNGCQWTAVSNAAWITITSASPVTGNATVTYSVSANTGTARTGTMTIAGLTYTVAQTGGSPSCSFTLTGGGSVAVGAIGGSGSVNLTAGSGCSWQATSTNTSWLTVTTAAIGSGNNKVTFTYANNFGPSRGAALNIGGQTFVVVQNAGNACDITQDFNLTVADAQAEVNQALGMATPANPLTGFGQISVVDVQLVINAVLGGACQGF